MQKTLQSYQEQRPAGLRHCPANALGCAPVLPGGIKVLPVADLRTNTKQVCVLLGRLPKEYMLFFQKKKGLNGLRPELYDSPSYCAVSSVFLVSRLLWFNYSLLQMVLANRSIDQEH